jgi:uncharacterized protein YegP (UPF0339 family)
MKTMRFVIHQDDRGRFGWRLIGDDGADLAASVEVFASATAAGRAASAVRLRAGSAAAPEDDPVLLSAAIGVG